MCVCVCVRVHIHVNSTAKPRYNCSLRQLMRYVACNIITTSLCQAPTTKVYIIWLQISLSATPSGRNGRAEFHTGYTNSKWPQWESRVPHRLHKLQVAAMGEQSSTQATQTPSGRNGRAEFHTGYTNSKWPQWESRVPHRLHKLQVAAMGEQSSTQATQTLRLLP